MSKKLWELQLAFCLNASSFANRARYFVFKLMKKQCTDQNISEFSQEVSDLSSIMNSSNALSILNTTLRMAMFCNSPNLWFVQDHSGLAVTWHGDSAWDFVNLKSGIGLNYEIITKLPEPQDNIYPPMLALMKGRADISIDFWGVNYKRSKLIDFSYPRAFVGDYIISAKPNRYINADLIIGVFDDESSLCLILALFAMIFVSWLIQQVKENETSSLVTCALYLMGNAFKQPLNYSIMPKALLGRALTTLFSAYNFIICLMYGCIIISLLIGGSRPRTINSLEDLNKTENMNIRIILDEKGYTSEFLKSANMLRGLEHRIDYHGVSDWGKPQMIKNILKGSHVAIYSLGTFGSHLCNTKGNNNLTIANREDFRHSR